MGSLKKFKSKINTLIIHCPAAKYKLQSKPSVGADIAKKNWSAKDWMRNPLKKKKKKYSQNLINHEIILLSNLLLNVCVCLVFFLHIFFLCVFWFHVFLRIE